MGEFIKGHGAEGLRDLFRGADHVFFRIWALVPAGAERVFWGGNAPSWFPACFFGTFSAGLLLLVWLIVRKTEKDETTAAWACFLAAGCVTGFYYSRHYFPYDTSLFVLLLSFWVGLGKTRWRRSWTTGCLAGIGYLTYNGYWSVAGALLVAHCCFRVETPRAFLVRALSAGVGLLTPILAVVILSRAVGLDYVAETAQFSRTVTQGDLGHGLRFIVEFTRESEGWYAAALLALLLASRGVIQERTLRLRGAGTLWILLGLVLLGFTVFFSDVVPRMVVYARTVKPLYLLLAIAAGVGFGSHPWFRNRWVGLPVAAGLLVIIAGNFAQPLRQRFPLDFRVVAQRAVDREYRHDPGAALGLLNASVFHRPVFLRDVPRFETILAAKHPLQFRPYVYDGYTQEMRDQFAAHDFTMRLVRFTEPQIWKPDSPEAEKVLQEHIGLVQVQVTLPDPLPVGTSEPLLVAGIPEHGDLLCLEYLPGNHGRMFLDHWNAGFAQSEPFDLKPGKHRVLISLGSLLPPDDSPVMAAFSELRQFRSRVLVEWDGVIVADLRTALYPAGTKSVRLGKNLIGGTTCVPEFTGALGIPRRVDPRALLLVLPTPAQGGAAGVAWPAGGGRALQFSFATEALVEDVPLFSMRRGDRTVRVVPKLGHDGAVFSIWMDGREVANSQKVRLSPGRHSATLLFPGLSEARGEAGLFENAVRQRACLLRVDDRVLWRGDLLQLSPAAASGDAEEDSARLYAFGSDWPISGETCSPREMPVEALQRITTTARTLSSLSSEQAHIGGTKPRTLVVKFALPTEEIAQQPLVWFGQPGAGDLIYVQVEPTRFRIGHDHWGTKTQMTAWCGRTRGTIDLRLEFAPETPSPKDEIAKVVVLADGDRVANFEARTFNFSGENWVVGWNLAGASTASAYFTGLIYEIRTEP